MTLKFALATALCIGMSACTTVDLAQVASQNAQAKTSAVQVNVVQRSAAKLSAAFTSKGWTTKASKKRVQSAASVLLKGLENVDTRQDADGYAATVKNASVVEADIRTAAQHVNQTTKAAEVYLAMAPASASLLPELSSLERALLTSREAEAVFARALENTDASSDDSLSSLTTSVNALRDVTDAFGDRVREGSVTALGAS